MKKKGFTLIELLAVIVVLAVIALIATPIIINVIEKTKKGALKDSAYGIIESANLYVASNLGSRDAIEFECRNNKCEEVICELQNKEEICSKKNNGKTITYKGSIDYAKLIIDEKRNISIYVEKDDYSAKKDRTDKEVKVYKKGEAKSIVNDSPSSMVEEILYNNNGNSIKLIVDDNSNFDSTNIKLNYKKESDSTYQNIECNNNICSFPIDFNQTYEYELCVSAPNGKQSCTNSVFKVFPSCDAGYTLNGTSCTKLEESASELYYTCNEGYTLNGTSCTKVETVNKVTSTCSSSYYSCETTNNDCPGAFHSNHCPAERHYECWHTDYYSCSSCPSGYSDNGSNCIRTVTADATPNCTEGYELDGLICKKNIVKEAVINITCPEGYSKINNICVAN